MHWWTDTYLEGRRINLLKDKELHFVLGHELRNYIENINIHGWEGEGRRQRVWKAGYTSETEENSTVDKIKKKILFNKKEKVGRADPQQAIETSFTKKTKKKQTTVKSKNCLGDKSVHRLKKKKKS